MLTENQEVQIRNIIKLVNTLKENNTKSKKEIELEKFIKENFENATEENILKIKKLLNIKNDNLLIEKNSSDFYLLKGFFLKLKEEGFNFPIKKEKEIIFDFEDKFDIITPLKNKHKLIN